MSTSKFNINMPAIEKVNAKLEVVHKPGAVRLDGYPLLVYAPLQDSHNHPDFAKPHDPTVHGPTIRVENNGTPVSVICQELAVNPDVEAVAAKYSTTAEHVRQAHDYAVAHVTN